MGYMTNMPDLTKEIPALVMDCLHHRLPSFNLLPGPDARSTGIAIASLRDCCGFRNQETTMCRPLCIVDCSMVLCQSVVSATSCQGCQNNPTKRQRSVPN
jgi:hypothetical protein